MLNKRTEILNKCRHRNKYALISDDSTRLEPIFLLKFPLNASHKMTVSRNLVGFSFPIAHQITEHKDFS